MSDATKTNREKKIMAELDDATRIQALLDRIRDLESPARTISGLRREIDELEEHNRVFRAQVVTLVADKKRLNNTACELALENDRLKESTPRTVYRETEAAEQAAVIGVKAALIKALKELLAERDGRIERLTESASVAIRAVGDRDEDRQSLADQVSGLDIRLRERDWLIETYRDKFAVMVKKIDDLTPDCHVCGDKREVECPDCLRPAPDGSGRALTCGNRKCRDGKVPCAECVKGATDG